MTLRTFFPFDTDDLVVHALEPSRIAMNAGRAVLIFKPSEAVNLADSLVRAAQVCGHTGTVPAFDPQEAPPVIDDAMVKRAVDAFEQWWCDFARVGGTTNKDVNQNCLKHVLQQALEVKA